MIQLRNIQKIYRSGEVEFTALHDLSLEIAQGEFVAILGSSGSGKSTLMNLLGCLDKPTQGQYFLDGVDVSTMGRKELARIRNQKLGFVFQSFNLLPRTTALENVEVPLLYRPGLSSAERARRSRDMLDRVGIGDKEKNFPSQMSGGQQQRVAIARALVTEPVVLLADEPTGNLDSKTSEDIMRFLQELNRAGITIVLVTHEHDIAQFAKRHVVLKDGKVLQDYLVSNSVGASA